MSVLPFLVDMSVRTFIDVCIIPHWYRQYEHLSMPQWAYFPSSSTWACVHFLTDGYTRPSIPRWYCWYCRYEHSSMYEPHSIRTSNPFIWVYLPSSYCFDKYAAHHCCRIIPIASPHITVVVYNINHYLSHNINLAVHHVYKYQSQPYGDGKGFCSAPPVGISHSDSVTTWAIFPPLAIQTTNNEDVAVSTPTTNKATIDCCVFQFTSKIMQAKVQSILRRVTMIR